MNTRPSATKDAVCHPELFHVPTGKKRQVTASFTGGGVTRDGGFCDGQDIPMGYALFIRVIRVIGG